MAYSEQVIEAAKGSKREYFLATFDNDVQSAQKQIEKFAADVLKNPWDALGNAERHFKAAAMHRVALQTIHLLQHSTELKDVTYQLHSNIMNKSRDLNSRSSGGCTNMMTDATIAAYVHAYERFDYVESLDELS